MNTSQPIEDNSLTVSHQSWAILLISVLGLFLETLFIRWIGTEIRIFAYLQNTILVVCFIGLGIGMFTASRTIDVKQSLLPIALLLLLMAIPATRWALSTISEMLSSLGDLVIWAQFETDDSLQRILFLGAGLVMTYGALILIVDAFVPLGRVLGRLMNIHPNPIWAYSINIAGSILGTWAFVLISYLYQPPFVWFLIAAGLFAIFILWSNGARRINFALLGSIIVLAWFASQVPNVLDVIWSPYQKLVVQRSAANWVGDYQIDVNNAGYQVILDLSDERVSAEPEKFSPALKGISQYDIPVLLHPNPQSVLIVGSGTGNDVAGALRNGAGSVTAVEIDPAIISIGTELHPEEPYQSARVKIVIDDARSHFATTTETYDVIVFGLLDSHTTTSLTNARLDHYVYTKESIEQAKSKLKEGGIIVLTFDARRTFIADRIGTVLSDVFNQPPDVFQIQVSHYGGGGFMFVTGDMANVRDQRAANPRLDSYIKKQQQEHPVQLPHSTKITTDDWPYLYLDRARIPLLYYALIALLVIIFWRSYRKWQAYGNILIFDRGFWHFFFLGAAFLLLEVQNISKASVVLGNTWQVNAVVITSVLTMALLANWIVHKFPKLPVLPVYILLIGVSVGLYFVDLARFGFLPYATKAIVVGALTSLPMLFSGMIFTRSFAETRDRSSALGANLIGALVGALLQSITFVTGIKALLLIVAALYLLSFFAMPSRSSLKERVSAEFAK